MLDLEYIDYLFDLEFNVSLKEIFGVCPIEIIYILVKCRNDLK